ncbi:DNA replication and repair protein RecF [Elizabethkingia meningoseptica]|uniref:DNA replication/repair protein RecF n=1 Tax=Elizabethkingia meningoseptica TaxID=238 RepID=UPI0023B09746|nr:DNA replication and repair protein RecF [Elizabethkingia meningoseptica]MDE5467756.1 DNA replication and repair protein RecF [Elizabethkingia meningoseptica]MDE5474675.1 DNA replication and repair protein RecF [Elizabethkingia meningoseptica]MDE5478108.1 DNA replication and repair protein RecF [Elizabethkingia meningoseptica]MDE5486015.1 DNA replication and repair protein RecF [Elizabethkingia meningoseptica]MDE5501901.1 DNA replication and repair protein RecF [Elizabethkingia meningoseptic
MLIQSIRLSQFKNHSFRQFDFSPQINCFVGNNGVGKTNILDALYYLSVGKSFLGNTDQNNIMQGEDFFNIEAVVADGEKENIIKIQQQLNSKKIIKKNDKSYDRLADHIGFLPSVIISPYDNNLISDSGDARRKFLDGMISQTDTEYLYNIIQYQKTLQQRNALLKAFQKNRYFDADSLDIYQHHLVKSGNVIHEKRKTFNEKFSPIVQKFYQLISDGKEDIEINYQSDLSEQDFEEILNQNLEKDRILTYTSRGTHKDDLVFLMRKYPLKKTGSQGQQKTFLISLKLAQMQMIKDITGKSPILLLDDIFDKLDDNRVSQLIALVNKENFGQIFITDTHKERTQSIVQRINEESRIFEL